MSHRKRISVRLALAMAILVPVAVAQKPKPPAPPPIPPSPPTTPLPSSSQPTQPNEDLVLFLRGRVATGDSTPVPHDVLVERVCNDRVRQQVYASPHGDFSMQLGSKADSFLDASGDPTPENRGANKNSMMGLPRRELTNCELRASATGFHPGSVRLVELDTFGGDINVGAIVVQRAAKIEGATLSVTPYKAPTDARKAYEKGLEAERHGKLDIARKYFEAAVQIYPRYTSAWFQLGSVLKKENQNDAARSSFAEATKIDTKFLPAYLSLASLAYEAENWTEVLDFTGHILALDPLNHVNVTGYILDLDPLSCNAAYFYNAVANYNLNRFEDAEKSGLKAEHVDLLSNFPQLHLLMAEIYTRKNDYATAISEIQAYLELVPRAKDTGQVREQLAKLEKLNGSVSASEKPDQK